MNNTSRMPSQLITPPDLVASTSSYLLINAHDVEVELLVRWLKTKDSDYNIHLYHSGMADAVWLSKAATQSQHILISRENSTTNSLDPLLDNISKIVWFGMGQSYASPLEYFLKNG